MLRVGFLYNSKRVMGPANSLPVKLAIVGGVKRDLWLQLRHYSSSALATWIARIARSNSFLASTLTVDWTKSPELQSRRRKACTLQVTCHEKSMTADCRLSPGGARIRHRQAFEPRGGHFAVELYLPIQVTRPLTWTHHACKLYY